jgi:hypothetical protein
VVSLAVVSASNTYAFKIHNYVATNPKILQHWRWWQQVPPTGRRHISDDRNLQSGRGIANGSLWILIMQCRGAYECYWLVLYSCNLDVRSTAELNLYCLILRKYFFFLKILPNVMVVWNVWTDVVDVKPCRVLNDVEF